MRGPEQLRREGERFARVWNAAATPAAAARALGLTPAEAAARALAVRRLGVRLKRMYGAGAVGREAARLHRRGWGAEAIARRTGLSLGYVKTIVRGLRQRDGLPPKRGKKK